MKVFINKMWKFYYKLPFILLFFTFLLCLFLFGSSNYFTSVPALIQDLLLRPFAEIGEISYLDLWMFGSTLCVLLIIFDSVLLCARQNKYISRSLYTWDYSSGIKSASIIYIAIELFACFKYPKLLQPILIAHLSAIICFWIKQEQGYHKLEINDSLDWKKSIGAFWAHHAYDSYYKIILQDICDRIAVFEKEFNLKLLVKKHVIVIPSSCNVSNLIEKDDKLTFISFLPIIQYDQGANIDRTYKNPVYKISSEDLYVAFEMPNSLMTLWKCRFEMEPEKLKYHLKCFTAALEILVKDHPCIVVKYDDTVPNPESLHSVLLANLTSKCDTVLCMEP